MSRFCLDTSIVSEFAPGRAALPRPWLDLLSEPGADLLVSAMTVAEIEEGIGKLERTGSRQRASALRLWLEALLARFGERVVPVDVELASSMGRMSDAAWAIGRNPGWADIAIAATASAHSSTLLTRNIRHFEPLGIAAVDPFASPPP